MTSHLNGRLFFGVGLLFIAHCFTTQLAAQRSVDVVVVGAGTGGTSAAIEAARLGVTVDLLEETDWIGGQMGAAGVATMDEGTKLTGPQGFYGEFRSRIDGYYASKGKAVGTCYYGDNNHCYEPHIAQKILYELIDDANGVSSPKKLNVHLRTTVARLLIKGKTVTGVVTNTGETIHAKVVVDATEYGDLLPLSPAVFRAGNNVSDRAQHAACVQSITYLAIIKKYPNGVPEKLMMHHAPPGYQESAFRQLLQRNVQKDGNPRDMTLPVSWAAHNVYRGMPDSSEPGTYSASQPEAITKTALNWFNDFPVDMTFFDRSKRHDIACRAKLKTLYFLYYVQNELGEKQWSVADDEGYDTPYNQTTNSCENIPAEFKAIEHNMPQMPYVRESQRVVGAYTLTSLDNRREGVPSISKKRFEDAVALGDYGNDLHGCAKEENLEPELEHVGDRVGDRGLGTGPFQIPLKALLPRDVDGFLLAEKNFSQSRFANGATRLQPSTMTTGQAVGALAALSVKQGVPPRNVPVAMLQKTLLEANASLALGTFGDAPVANETWRAAQFVATHRWMDLTSDGVFGYNEIMSRGDAVEALANAFALSGGYASWRGNSLLKATYSDVPLYHRYSAPVEAVLSKIKLAACDPSSKLFCPGLPATQEDFVTALLELAATSREPIDRLSQQEIANLQSWKTSAPLTRAVAARILFVWGAQHAHPAAAADQGEGE